MKRQITANKVQLFKRHLCGEEKSPATIDKYVRDVRAFCAYAGTNEITKELVLSYKKKLGADYAASSANSMIAALNCFLCFCDWPELRVKQFKMQRQAFCSEDRELTRSEYIRLIDAASRQRNERLKLIIQTICGTGIRVSELQFVTVESLQKGEAIVKCKGKNRRIFIVPELKKRLIGYVKKRKITKGAVFVTRSGRPISRNNIWREMKGLCEDAHVSPSKVFPHNLRHLFARTFYGLEKDIAKLADILGHASINTTRVYIVTTGTEHKRKMERMRLIV